MKALGDEHLASKFIDLNMISLNSVLLHNGNEFPSIPVAYATHSKDCCDVMKILLLKINYRSLCWSIISDFTTVLLLEHLKQSTFSFFKLFYRAA